MAIIQPSFCLSCAFAFSGPQPPGLLPRCCSFINFNIIFNYLYEFYTIYKDTEIGSRSYAPISVCLSYFFVRCVLEIRLRVYARSFCVRVAFLRPAFVSGGVGCASPRLRGCLCGGGPLLRAPHRAVVLKSVRPHLKRE